MKNLFHDIVSEKELEQIFARCPRRPLLPPLGSEPWKRARENPVVAALAAPLRERALRECGAPLPVLTDELYASFRATGRRIAFEQVYFERRRQLARAVISLLLAPPSDAPSGALTASMLEKLESIFDEVSWALPAHVNWHNDDVSGKEPMQIDLFCAETANLMAEVLDLLGGLVPAALRARVRERLRTHVWENYAANFERFHWPKVTHNWNAVCHQGVLGSALSQVEDAALLARMFWLARQSLPLFLGGFAPDGGCTEGIGYWSYGFGWFAVLNEQLEERTGGELSLFEGDEHVRRIARFGPCMSLSGGKLVNFSDNGAEGTLGGPLLTYLGNRLGERDCLREGMKGYRSLAQKGIGMDAERCDVFFLGRLFLRCPEKIDSGDEAPNADCFLPDLAVLVAHGRDARGRIWDFAAKAGHNDEHHNHNDCAGFLLNVGGVRFVAEIGAPEYTKNYFSDKRYEELAARSLGHSVPLINGAEQAAGKTFTSRVDGHTLDNEAASLAIRAAAAYPDAAGCDR
ncbi:MAG TPA: heparinase II/III family protein, partial [Candidatus Methylacidiphilales bacterium]|nr:heparinase II/III family protein [Candidatus Methylacidiphilales bacterium]